MDRYPISETVSTREMRLGPDVTRRELAAPGSIVNPTTHDEEVYLIELLFARASQS